LNKSAYTRPNKPRKLIVTNRKKGSDVKPLAVPEAVTVDASTECFTTPGPVIQLMIDHASLQDGQLILEPSAGTGAIVGYILKEFPAVKLDVFELNLTLQEILKGKGYNLRGSDFLGFDAKPEYDRILMNPPFSKLQDIDHVLKAYECLRYGGRLVSVMSPGAFFHTRLKACDFRFWFKKFRGECYDLPPESFKNSGTDVNSKIIVIDKE